MFDLYSLAGGDSSSPQRYRSNHNAGHGSLLYAEGDSKMYLVGGGRSGHIRCWRESQPNKPMWVVKRSESEVKALGWVHQHEVCHHRTTSTVVKAKRTHVVLSSKSSRMGLKRKQSCLNGPVEAIKENHKPLISEIDTEDSQKPPSTWLTRKVLVAALSDGSISLWDMNNMKVRCMGSVPTPALIATLHTRDLSSPYQAHVYRFTPHHSQSTQLNISFTNGLRVGFKLTGNGPSARLVPILPTSDVCGQWSSRFDERQRLLIGSVVSCATESGASSQVSIDACFIESALHLKLGDNRICSFGQETYSNCSRVTVESNPRYPYAAVLIDNDIAAVLKV